MNIKISIKDCDCPPAVSNNKLVSEVEHKKKTMLYAPPENDRKNTQLSRPPIHSNPDSNNKKPTINMNSKEYRESERQMLNELKKNGQNRVTPDMIQTSNNILQKQNEILEQNQRTLHSMVNKNNASEEIQAESIRNQVKDALDQIKNQVTEIKKMRTQIANAAQEFNKNVTDLKNGRPQKSEIPNQIFTMNSDMRNMVQTSQNHLEGLQNMEALKSLQNFNMEGYSQAINQLKKQIGQYLKQSENIERELKIRTAKLEKLELPPKFQQQLYRPYQEHLNNRVKNIDLHAIRERVYEKIGGFDYGKFETDIGNLMIEARSQLGNFPIICKEHAILVPEIRIDPKQLKNLDMKLPSVLDEYKSARGIKFDDPKKPKQSEPSQAGKTAGSGLSRTNQLQQRLKKANISKKPTNLQRIVTQPVDLAHQAKLTKQSDKRPTILQNEQKKDKRQLQERMQKSSKEKKRQDESFEKYLQNRAREELELLYKEKKQRLQRMQNQLYQQATNPTYIDLNLKKQQIQAKKQPAKKNEQEKKKVQQPQEEYGEEQFEKQSEEQRKKSIVIEEPKRTHHTDVRQMGRQILKQKLKNLLGERNKSPQITHATNFIPRGQESASLSGERQIQNIATGFITMINNTLAQVNNNLARSIERKIEQSSEKRPTSLQRRQSKKIVVPKLQSFRSPPTFNINLAQQPNIMPYIPYPAPPQLAPQEPKKIVVETYDQYKLDDNNNYESYEISSDEDDN